MYQNQMKTKNITLSEQIENLIKNHRKTQIDSPKGKHNLRKEILISKLNGYIIYNFDVHSFMMGTCCCIKLVYYVSVTNK